MAQYKIGTVYITNGSTYVSGAGTLWYSSGIQEGDLFNLAGNNGWYYVSAVHSNTRLSLTAPYAGGSVAGEEYVIHRDFLDTYKIPLMNKGSTNWPSLYNEAMRKLNIALGGDATSGSGLGLDAAYNAENVITVDDDAVVLNRVGVYGASNRANALRITDANTDGPSTGTPFNGALSYIYSKHRVPFIAVTNQADEGDSDSPSTTPQFAMMGVAFAGDHSSYPSGYENVGVVGYAHDYHNKYGYSRDINVGVRAHSQRGYGLVATSDALPAIRVEQEGAAPGMSISCASGYGLQIESPLGLRILTNTYSTSTFAGVIGARRGGLYIDSTLTPTETYPSLGLSALGGIAIAASGKFIVNNYDQTGIEINAGLAGIAPALDITSQGDGIDVYGGGVGSYGIIAESYSKPAIRAVDGVNLFSSDHAAIGSPDIGTLVYSGSVSGLMVYDNYGWASLDWAGGSVSACECNNGVRIYNSNVMANIPNPQEGTIIYDATTQELYFSDNTGWQLLAGGMGANGGGTKGISMLVTGFIGAELNVASFNAPYNGAITRLFAQVDEEPDGSDITIDVLVNGVSILGGTLLTIEDGLKDSNIIATSVALSVYDIVSVDIVTVGSSVAGGNDLRVVIYLTEENEESRLSVVSIDSGDSPYQLTVLNRYVMCNTTGHIVINAPAASASTGIPYTFKKTNINNMNTITLSREVDGGTLVISAPREAVTIISDGTNYNRV